MVFVFVRSGLIENIDCFSVSFKGNGGKIQGLFAESFLLDLPGDRGDGPLGVGRTAIFFAFDVGQRKEEKNAQEKQRDKQSVHIGD